ncbi:unnamed protein product [Rotaria sp. Silwood1]|nr:unnamed protein product [Rotaria sp. Silwood1]
MAQILLAGGCMSVYITSTGYTLFVDAYSNVIKYNITQTSNADSTSLYDIDAYTIKLTDQAILMIIFCLTLIVFLAHIIFKLRYRHSWHRVSYAIASLCIIYAFTLFGISVFVAYWEDKLRKSLTSTHLNNQRINTPNGLVKPQIGSAAVAAAFGFAACCVFLAEALIRFCHLADKIQT